MKTFVLVACTLLASLVLTLLAFGLPLQESLTRIAIGAFGGEIGWSRTLVNMTPLLLTGLGMVVAWRAGMYNIGGEGQYIIGGLFGAAVAKAAGAQMPPNVLMPFMLASTALGGALFAGLAGWLQVSRGVQAVISTILLNFIALQILGWAVQGPLQESDKLLPQTERLAPEQMLLKFTVRTDLHLGVVFAVLIAVAVGIYLRRTVGGFQLRLVGENASAARAAGLRAERIQLKAMMLSGAMCGLAGGIQYVGVTGSIDAGFSQNWGFLGIPVALLGGLDAFGVLLSSFVFGALFAGAQQMARFGLGGDSVIYVIQAVSVLAFIAITSRQQRRRIEVTEEEAARG